MTKTITRENLNLQCNLLWFFIYFFAENLIKMFLIRTLQSPSPIIFLWPTENGELYTGLFNNLKTSDSYYEKLTLNWWLSSLINYKTYLIYRPHSKVAPPKILKMFWHWFLIRWPPKIASKNISDENNSTKTTEIHL